MKVRSREGQATHLVPESCAGVREELGEALTGADASRALRGQKTLCAHRSTSRRRREVPWLAAVDGTVVRTVNPQGAMQ